MIGLLYLWKTGQRLRVVFAFSYFLMRPQLLSALTPSMQCKVIVRNIMNSLQSSLQYNRLFIYSYLACDYDYISGGLRKNVMMWSHYKLFFSGAVEKSSTTQRMVSTAVEPQPSTSDTTGKHSNSETVEPTNFETKRQSKQPNRQWGRKYYKQGFLTGLMYTVKNLYRLS